MATETPTKPLGQPIEGEDRDATVTCPAGHSYGLYYHDIRNDFCLACERRKARTTVDTAARKRADRLAGLRVASDRARQLEDDRARQAAEAAARGPRRRRIGG